MPPSPPPLFPEAPPPRERDPPRDLEPLLRELRPLELRDAFAAPPERFAADLEADGLRAADERLEAAPEDFAREGDDFFAPLLERALVERERDAADLRGADLRADDLRAPPLRDDDDEPAPTADSTSAVHLPESTR